MKRNIKNRMNNVTFLLNGLLVILSIILFIGSFSSGIQCNTNDYSISYHYFENFTSYVSPYNYSGSKAVQYALMVHEDYLHTAYYPSGINQSIMQKNMDHFNSEDCAHFVSEALIAGGLTALAQNPPGDNLTNYLSGFPGSYGIVGAYRLADWLAGYDLPIFPANATDEALVGYQPIPASYYGSPEANVFYVLNYTMLPSYFLSPGDVIIDGGAGNGHAMLYIGNGDVVQTDPAAIWQYSPAVDANITFTGIYNNRPFTACSYDGKNVSALYIHIPMDGFKGIWITALVNGTPINNTSSIRDGERITLIGSFPDGIGIGNFTYDWYVNGKLASTGQFFNFNVSYGYYVIKLVASGIAGSVNSTITFNLSNSKNSVILNYLIISISIIVVASAIISFAYYRRSIKPKKP